MSSREGRMAAAPGSDEAVASGCRCSPKENNGGAGYGAARVPPSYILTLGCPLHLPIG